MGVLGLYPFLQKACPDVFKVVPDRFRAFQGKTIVFDGTLVTQRLHFAPLPHPNRHVLGWYRIMQELRESSVTAICVFDGKLRNSAKQMEVERRREERKTTASRGVIEQHRSHRLQELTKVVDAVRQLEQPAQTSVLDSLRASLSDPQSHPEVSRPPDPEVSRPSSLPVMPSLGHQSLGPSVAFRAPSRESETDLGAYYVPDASELSEILEKPASISHDVSQEPPLRPTDFDQELDTTSSSMHTDIALDEPLNPSVGVLVHDTSPDLEKMPELYELIEELAEDLPGPPSAATPEEPFNPSVGVLVHDNSPDLEKMPELYEYIEELAEDPPGPPSPATPDQPVPTSDLTDFIGQLYEDYRKTSENLTHTRPPELGSSLVAPEESLDPHAERIMSKAQQQLTIEEGHLWDQLLHSESPVTEKVETLVTTLSQKSSILTESYKRRTQAPTQRTYEESKEVLRAMGIPCFETNGPFEAEALASAMVLQGQADYVASEDTDVLVYGAPLIRNVSTKDDPLVVVSGADVWDALQLDQDRFIDLALLLGTDFSQRIKNVGPQRALKFIREHGTIERILEHEQQFPPRSPAVAYLQQIALARMVFRTLPPLPNRTDLQQPADESAVQWILQKYSLWRLLSQEEELPGALAGNYFDDKPFAS